MNGCTQLIMPQNPGIRIIHLQLPEQVKQRTLLRISTCIGGTSFLIESALIANADALVIPTGGMGANLVNRTANVHPTVTSNVEMITDTGKTPRQMSAAKRLHRKTPVATRGTTMNYQEVHLPIVLIKTACRHRTNLCRSLNRIHLPEQ